MCGICGWISWDRPPETPVVEAMNNRLVHRGPDFGQVIADGPAVLGHRRLTIVDLSPDSNQPLADHSGRYLITFNGEIYNYRELRRELEGLGARFRTRGDTEVILEAYKQWGADCLPRLDGMFALAIWDVKSRRLFLARDRLGEKPLLYCVLPGGGIAFASELGALCAHPQVPRDVDPAAVGQFLSLNYILGNRCILSGVEKLLPGHYALAEAGKPVRQTRYWDLLPHFQSKGRWASEAEAAEQLNALIEESARSRLVSDVPVGAFLSGGLDSAIMVGAASRLDGDVLEGTYTMGFREESYDESAAAEATAKHFGGANHNCRVMEPPGASELEEILTCAGEPFADTSIIPVYKLSQMAGERVKVALSGDGGDELFGGYSTYQADKLRHWSAWMPGAVSQALHRTYSRLAAPDPGKVSLDYKIRQFLKGHHLGFPRCHCFWRNIFDDAGAARLVRGDVAGAVAEGDAIGGMLSLSGDLTGLHYLDAAMQIDLNTWLPDDILVKADRASMAHSLELRPPFLNPALVEFAASLPPEWRLRGLRGKYILKRSQQRFLPRGIGNRRKQGFNAPVSYWLKGDFGELVRSTILSAKMQEWFEAEEIETLWSDHQAGRRDNGLKLFGLLCLGSWMRWIDGQRAEVAG